MKHKHLKPFLPKRLYHWLDTLHSYRPVSFALLHDRYEVQLLKNGDLLRAAKQLHATSYLRHGFVSAKDIKKGVIHSGSDPYQKHAYYFGVIDKENREVIAVARQIYHSNGTTLPVFKHIKLNKSYLHLHPSQTVEISAFTKKPGVDSRALLLLFHAMLQHSKEERHRYWLMACDKMIYWRLKSMFGPVIHKIGPVSYYMGSEVVPAEIDIDKAPRSLRIGYQLSVPPLRHLRRFLYTSFTEKHERKKARLTPQTYFWDSYSRAYDGLLFFHPYQHLVNHVVEKVLALKPHTVLDLGCGTGNISKEIVMATMNTKVDAVDWSPQMLEQLRRKINDKRLGVFESEAITYLQETRKKYDVIVMNNVLYTINSRQQLWPLLQKRLQDGGYVVLANPDTGNSTALIKDHIKHRSLRTLFQPALLKIWLYDLSITLLGTTTTYDFTSEKELKRQLHEHGFKVVGKIERCYGGHENGIDLLLTARKQESPI